MATESTNLTPPAEPEQPFAMLAPDAEQKYAAMPESQHRLTNPPPAEVPAWADTAMTRLAATICPTADAPIEAALLDAAFILLRERFGRSTLPDSRTVARSVIASTLAELDAEVRA